MQTAMIRKKIRHAFEGWSIFLEAGESVGFGVTTQVPIIPATNWNVTTHMSGVMRDHARQLTMR
ncbi:hypothetical protein BW686_09720 [Pseudomonas syringae]|uniref:Uncharacterized protein n=1 Tax=Pseudomonas syringae TaxID=317 RepID=A0A244ETG9_PSESX|nr:hypothetical protein BW686_09720 [Pseudomonas syringae]